MKILMMKYEELIPAHAGVIPGKKEVNAQDTTYPRASDTYHPHIHLSPRMRG